ncbi:MAG: ABC transporter substrate-binding protein, partial [Desulfobacterales bacterium]|nr:ABC transporter substrate-binding protein [Desulfobacterales bacterium]
MPEGNYWTSRRVSRRTALRGAGLGLLGLTGAALIGCGDDGVPQATSTPGAGATAAPVLGGATPVPADQVRLQAGQTYSGIFPTPAEMDPLVNGKYGGTLVFRNLDTPHMDFNRILSCTVGTPMDLTKNKLFRLVVGAQADPSAIEIEPDLVESYEISADLMQYTLHLRKGVKFHNVAPTFGREFDSEDVKLSIERYQGPGVQKDVFSEVSRIDTPDAHTVVITLGQPMGEFPHMVASWSYMDAREMIADLDFLGQHAVGTGPFIHESWAPKEGHEFVRNPEYFEEGLPFLDRVSSRVMEDTSTIQSAFITQNVHDYAAANLDVENQILQQARDTAVSLNHLRVQGVNTEGFHFQMKNPVWHDERVRRAFSMAIDRKEWSIAQFG